MNISDPIADMLTRIRNASRARHTEVVVPASRTKREIARILKDEGFIADVSEGQEGERVILPKLIRAHPSPRLADHLLAPLADRDRLLPDRIFFESFFEFGQGLLLIA